MKTILFFTLGLFSFYTSAQDEFRLKYNDSDEVEYQGVVKNDSVKAIDLFNMAVDWVDKTDRNQTIDFKDETLGKIVAKSTFSTVGKKSAYGKSYNYTFVCDVVLEFKDGKTRYTLENFKKKTSPGEPGSSLEYFIDNYKPNISSKKSRDREAKMLDQIELAIQDQVWDLIDEIKKKFGPDNKSDW